MRDLVIFGAGGFGREAVAYAQDAGQTVAGLVDDNPHALDGFDLPVGVLGPISAVDVSRYDWVIALGDTTARRNVHRTLAAQGASFRSLIHPTSYVAHSAEVADGAILCPFSMVGAHATVGANVAINIYASVGHDAVVGAHSVLSPYATLNGAVRLEESVFLGSGAVVTPGVTVGRNSKISVLTAATYDLKPGSLLAGARPRSRVMYAVDDD